MRKIVWTFQASIEEVGREAELNEIRDEAAYLLEELNEDVITGTTKINTEEKNKFWN
jgi:hypothetical protein